jgi:hypothetical protein
MRRDADGFLSRVTGVSEPRAGGLQNSLHREGEFWVRACQTGSVHPTSSRVHAIGELAIAYRASRIEIEIEIEIAIGNRNLSQQPG